MKPKTIIGLVLIVGFTSLLFLNFGSQVGGYMNFAEAEKSGASAHVIGYWEEGRAFKYDASTNVFTFHMRDEDGNVRKVRYANPKPANFEEAEKLVIEGYADQDGFIAESILVKCPSKYNDSRPLNGAETASS